MVDGGRLRKGVHLKTAVLVAGAVLLSGCGRRGVSPSLVNPQSATFNPRGPDQYAVELTTTKGAVRIEVTRAWAPIGADRFYNLVRTGYYDGLRLQRIRPGYIAQFGIHNDTAVIRAWKNAYIPDDPKREKNTKGTIAFAFAPPNGRTTQVYINLADNAQLDAEAFAIFGRVTSGMDVVEAWYGGYGEAAGGGIRGGNQVSIEREGAAWLDRNYPLLDRILKARVIERR
jgi:homoserine O-acetyltransferase